MAGEAVGLSARLFRGLSRAVSGDLSCRLSRELSGGLSGDLSWRLSEEVPVLGHRSPRVQSSAFRIASSDRRPTGGGG